MLNRRALIKTAVFMTFVMCYSLYSSYNMPYSARVIESSGYINMDRHLLDVDDSAADSCTPKGSATDKVCKK